MYDFEKEKKKLLQAKTPEKYIELSHKSPIKGPRKSIITREWIQKTGFTIEDIQYARNRHPHWKQMKANGSYERTRNRINNYDFSEGKKITWTKDLLEKFYDLNNKGYFDHELAKEFETTLPSVNHIRRKINFAKRILELEGKGINKKKIVDLCRSAEQILKNKIRDLQAGRTGTILEHLEQQIKDTGAKKTLRKKK